MIQIKRSELRQLAQNKLGESSLESQNKILVMIGTSLSARTSYTVVGEEKEINYENLIALTDRMINQVPFHASPFEHCAKAMGDDDLDNWMRMEDGKVEVGWCRNFKGFIQLRAIM